MFISKSLAKKLRHPASVLLRDGVDKDGIPKIVVRQVKSAWGKFEPTGRQGGVCFSALSDGTTQTIYAGLLGYHTGTEASIQPLILNDYFWRSKMPYNDWPDFLRQAAENCLLPEQTPILVSQPQSSQPRTIGSVTMVRKPALFRPLAGREESRTRANRRKRNHILQQDWKHCLFRLGIRVLSALIAL